jgi:hypothetical protein
VGEDEGGACQVIAATGLQLATRSGGQWNTSQRGKRQTAVRPSSAPLKRPDTADVRWIAMVLARVS